MPKMTRVVINGDSFMIPEKIYNNIIAYSTKINDKGDPEINWEQVTSLVEHSGNFIGHDPIANEEL